MRVTRYLLGSDQESITRAYRAGYCIAVERSAKSTIFDRRASTPEARYWNVMVVQSSVLGQLVCDPFNLTKVIPGSAELPVYAKL